MMGIPQQTPKSYDETLKKAIDLNFGHMSTYMLTIEKETPFYKRYEYDIMPLPTTDAIVDMYSNSHNTLTNKGFHHYEVSNYA